MTKSLFQFIILQLLFCAVATDCVLDRDCQAGDPSAGFCDRGSCVCRPSHSYVNGRGCISTQQSGGVRYEIKNLEATWDEASIQCRLEMGKLAQVHTGGQNGEITNLLKSTSSACFFGLSYNTKLKWSDGTLFDQKFRSSFSNFNFRREAVYTIDRQGDWSLGDPKARRCYVCQYDNIDYEVVTTPKNFEDAKQYCRDKGSDIVSTKGQTELDYIKALYSKHGIPAGWMGLEYLPQDYRWRWLDGSGRPFMGLMVRPTFSEVSRVQVELVYGNYIVVDGRDTAAPFICKTSELKRDCSVIKSLSPSAPTGGKYLYYIRPQTADKYAVYCDMVSDGGGYTYSIRQFANIQYQHFKRFCQELEPIDIVSTTQVLELARILGEADVNDVIYPIAKVSGDRYLTLGSGEDISQIVSSLIYDYNKDIAEEVSAAIRGNVMLGIKRRNGQLTHFNSADGLICSTNNKQAPPSSFSAVFTPTTGSLLTYNIPEPVSLKTCMVCVWLSSTSDKKEVVYTAISSGHVILQLVLDTGYDHVLVQGIPSPTADFNIRDGGAHRVCLRYDATNYMYDVIVDRTVMITQRIDKPLLLEGSVIVGGDKLDSSTNLSGTVHSLDIYSNIDYTATISYSYPLYRPGDLIRWSDFYGSSDLIKPAQLFGHSRFKVGIGPSGLRWSKNYCKARGGELGAPRDDYEFTLAVQLFQGFSGWLNVYRANNTLYSQTTTPTINLTYIPSSGPDGNLTINGEGDLEVRSPEELLPFLCQFDVKEEVPEQFYCLPEEQVTEKGHFSWVRASTNSTVKVICPHGTIENYFSQGYSSRTCQPGESSTTPQWGPADLSRCNYANTMTRQLDSLRQLTVSRDNAVQIAGLVLSITNNTKDLDDTGVTMVTGIIEQLVDVQNSSATNDITQSLSNILEVDQAVLSRSQETGRIADRIIDSLEKVAGSVADTADKTLNTKNIKIKADKVSGVGDIKLVAENGVNLELPASSVPGNKSAFIITYTSNKLFITRMLSAEEALALHSNKSLPSPEFLNTPIISAGVDREVIRDLETPVQLVFPVNHAQAGGARCVYYSTTNKTGQWREEGLTTHYNASTGHVTCRSDHMTSFAVIMTIQAETHPIEGTHAVIMNTISYLCLFLSLVGLILTIMALSLQQSLWRLDMTKIHVYLSMSLFVGYVLFLVGIDQTQSRVLCITSAFLMHLAFLTAFVWMAIEAYTLYLQFVKVFPSYTPNFIPKCLVVVFSVPLAIAGGFLIAALTDNPDNYYELENYCWIKSYTLYYGFILPILLIVSCNLVLFGYVTRNICRIVTLNKNEDNQLGKLSVQLRATISVLVVLGVTWVIGAFTFGSTSILFQYIFIILNGLQGFSIFLFHVILKPEVRKRWYNSIHDITTSLSSNSHALKSHSFHRAHKFQVQNLRGGRGNETEIDESQAQKYNNNTMTNSLCSSNSQKPLLVNDKRYTYLSSSNDYATIESRPSSVSSVTSDVPNGGPQIRHQPATPPDHALRDSGTSSIFLKRPLSTVASMDMPQTPGDTLTPTPSTPGDPLTPTPSHEGLMTPGDEGFAFSPITHPKSWEYNPLNQAEDPLTDNTELREGEVQV